MSNLVSDSRRNFSSAQAEAAAAATAVDLSFIVNARAKCVTDEFFDPQYYCGGRNLSPDSKKPLAKERKRERTRVKCVRGALKIRGHERECRR